MGRWAFFPTPEGGVSFTPGTPVETEFGTGTSPWDITVNIAADDDALFVDFAVESTNTLTSVVLDPAGAAISLTLINSAANGASKCWGYGKWGGLGGLSGSKILRITWSAAAAGSAVHCTFKGAANATPTPTDTDASAAATSLSNTLTAPNANGVAHFVGIGNTADGALSGGFTQTGSRLDGTAFYSIKQARKVGSLGNPESPGMTQSSATRLAMIAYVVNPA